MTKFCLLASAVALATLPSCTSDDEPSPVSCGMGTVQMGTVCVPSEPDPECTEADGCEDPTGRVSCGAGTLRCEDECIAESVAATHPSCTSDPGEVSPFTITSAGYGMLDDGRFYISLSDEEDPRDGCNLAASDAAVPFHNTRQVAIWLNAPNPSWNCPEGNHQITGDCDTGCAQYRQWSEGGIVTSVPAAHGYVRAADVSLSARVCEIEVNVAFPDGEVLRALLQPYTAWDGELFALPNCDEDACRDDSEACSFEAP